MSDLSKNVDALHVKGIDGIVRPLNEHYDGMPDVEQDPYGAWLAIQNLSTRLAEAEARNAALVEEAAQLLPPYCQNYIRALATSAERDALARIRAEAVEIARQAVWDTLNGSQEAERLCDAIDAAIRKGD